MTAGRAMYPTLDAYYAADERRLRSEEADYGVHWRLQGWITAGGSATSGTRVRSTPFTRVPPSGRSSYSATYLRTTWMRATGAPSSTARSSGSWPNGQSTVGGRMACAGCETA